MSDQAEHKIYYVMTGVSMSQAAQIKSDGNVEVTGDGEVDRIDGDTFVWCDTCKERVYAGDSEHGLAEYWEVL